MVLEGIDLARTARRTDHEKIGDVGDGAQVQHNHPLGLLFEGRACSDERLRLAVGINFDPRNVLLLEDLTINFAK
jgi:hypothetical protein